jgi:hypothetical protein
MAVPFQGGILVHPFFPPCRGGSFRDGVSHRFKFLQEENCHEEVFVLFALVLGMAGLIAGCASTSARIRPGKTEIKKNAFYNKGLTAISIPDSVTTIGA